MCSVGTYTFPCPPAKLTLENGIFRYLFVRVTNVYNTFYYRKTPPATIRAGCGYVIRPKGLSHTLVEPKPPVNRPVTLNTDSFVVDWLAV